MASPSLEDTVKLTHLRFRLPAGMSLALREDIMCLGDIFRCMQQSVEDAAAADAAEEDADAADATEEDADAVEIRCTVRSAFRLPLVRLYNQHVRAFCLEVAESCNERRLEKLIDGLENLASARSFALYANDTDLRFIY